MRKNPAQSTAPVAPDTSPLARLARNLDRVGRIALCLVIVVAVIFSLQTVQELRLANQPTAEIVAASASEPSQDALYTLLNGDWSFAGIPWGVRTLEMSQGEMEQAFNAQVTRLERVSTSSGESPSTDYAMLTSILEMLDARRMSTGPNTSYQVQTPDLRVVAYAPHDEPEQVQLARFAQRLGDDQWNYVELVRRSTIKTSGARGDEPLLPTAPANSRLAVRHDAKGRLCAELIECHTELAELQARWAAAGWQVATQAADSDQTFRKDLGSLSPLPVQQLLLCTRGAESVVAIASQPAGEGPRTLLLIRSLE